MKSVDIIIKELRSNELKNNPSQLADYLVILSASLNQAGNFELDAEMDYAKKWEEIKLNTIDLKGKPVTDKMVEMKSKQTEEYRLWQQMRIANKCVQEVIRSIKKKLQNLETEYKEGMNF